MANEPSSVAVEYFTRKAEEEKSKRNLTSEDYEPPLATKYFAEQEKKKAQEIEAARSQTRSLTPMESVPVDHFTRLGRQDTEEKARQAQELAEQSQPIAVKKFTQEGEVQKSMRALDTGLNANMSVATKYFHRLEEDEKAARAEAQEGQKDMMPAAIQKFSTMAFEERAIKKAALEESISNPPPVPPGIAHFTPGLNEE